MQSIGNYYQSVNDKLNNCSKSSSERSSFIQPNAKHDPFANTEQMYLNQHKDNAKQ